jgi:sarcosine oxidase, subunit beta
MKVAIVMTDAIPRPDVLVLGLGIIGASIAYHLADAGLQTLALDRSEPAIAPAASWASAGGVRRQGRHPAEALLATEAIARWPTLTHELQADLQYRQGGQLLCAETEAEVALLADFVARQHSLGFSDVCLINQADVRKHVPGIYPGVLAASYSPADGQADAALATRAFVAAAQRSGAAIWQQTAVLNLLLEHDRIVGVHTSRGPIYADQVVLAAGAWSMHLAAQVGIFLPVRMVAYQMLLSTPAQPGILHPVIGSLNRALSLKQLDTGSFLIGGGHPGVVAPDGQSCSLSEASKAANWQTACELLPSVGIQQLAQAWCGLEALSIDEIPVIGAADIAGLYLAYGFSGHGFAIAPAVGQAVASELTGQRSTSLEQLRPQRMRQLDREQIAAFLTAADARLPG